MCNALELWPSFYLMSLFTYTVTHLPFVDHPVDWISRNGPALFYSLFIESLLNPTSIHSPPTSSICLFPTLLEVNGHINIMTRQTVFRSSHCPSFCLHCDLCKFRCICASYSLECDAKVLCLQVHITASVCLSIVTFTKVSVFLFKFISHCSGVGV